MKKDDKRRSPFEAQTYTVEGLAAVSEYLRFRPDAVKEVHCVAAARRSVEELLTKTKARVPVREISREPTRDDAPRKPPQGGRERSQKPSATDDAFRSQAPVLARVTLKAMASDAAFSRLKTRTKDLVVALDHTTDPRNLGAIARSAAFFGVREIFLPERRQVLLTQAAVSTAQGAFALTDLVCVVNLNRTLDELKERGYWVIGADMVGEPVQKLGGVYEKVVLVLGNEESGLSKNVRERCDRIGAIFPPTKTDDTLESLNVSVAAGIMLASLATPAAP